MHPSIKPSQRLVARCHLGSHVVNAAAPHLLLTWMMPPCILLSNYPTGPVASPRCVAAAHGSYHFGDPRSTMLHCSSLLIFWDSQLTSDHLTQARATLRSVHPSGHSPKQRCNLCIHLFSLRVPHESAHKVLAAGNLMRAHLVHNCSQANTPTSLRPVTPGLVASDIVWEQKTAKKSLGPAPEPVLSHSLSTTSLRPRSLLSCKGSYIWLILALIPTGAGTGFCSVRVWPLAQAPSVLSSPACPGTLYSLHVTRSY